MIGRLFSSFSTHLCDPPFRVPKSHAAEADSRHIHAGVAELRVFHVIFLPFHYVHSNHPCHVHARATRCSFTGQFQHIFGKTRPLHRDLGSGTLDLLQIVCCQFDINRTDVFLQTMQLCCTGDGHNPGLLGQ